jgi:hypothetical protein
VAFRLVHPFGGESSGCWLANRRLVDESCAVSASPSVEELLPAPPQAPKATARVPTEDEGKDGNEQLRFHGVIAAGMEREFSLEGGELFHERGFLPSWRAK